MPRVQDPGVVKLAVIPGDGIGPEVIAEAEKVLDAATAGSGIRFEKTRFSLGAARFLDTGDTLTDADLDAIKDHDAILLGAVGGVPGDPRLKDANIERGLLLKLRFELDHYVNLRPSKLYPGVPGPLAEPGDIDFVVVREGTEGPYVGNGGSIRRDTPHEVANETSVNTAFGVASVRKEWLNVARTLEVGPIRRAFTVILPAAAPTILTGMRISIGIAWLVIVAAEMLVGGTGIGYFVWNEWNNLSIVNVINAILLIGIVGMVLDQILAYCAKLVTFPE